MPFCFYMTILSLYNRVKALDTAKIAVEAVTETSKEREVLNLEQMNQGYRSDGSEILPSYTDYTIEIKKAKGQPFDHVTLQDTGAFYAGLKSTVSGSIIETTSSDIKTAKLEKKYETAKGKLFGLGGEFKGEYIEKSLRPAFNKKVSEKIGLKLGV